MDSYYNKYVKYKMKYCDIKKFNNINTMNGGNPKIYNAIYDEFREFAPSITENASEITVSIVCSAEEEIQFIINNAKMHIESMTLCGKVSGTTILNKIIALAKNINLETIDLVDGSSIYLNKQIDNKCYISLSALYILLHGISWYNKFGFISDEYNIEKTENDLIRKLSVSEFIHKIFKKDTEESIRQIRETTK